MKTLRRLSVALVSFAAVVGAGVPSTAAAVTSTDVSAQVSARKCNTAERPRQIRLVLGPGAVICYGGAVGQLNIDDIYATGLSAGDYTGIIWEAGHGFIFNPGDFVRLDTTVVQLDITPPN